MPRRRTHVHLCEVCGQPVYGDETVCPPCLGELDRILGEAVRSASNDDGNEVAVDVGGDHGAWIDQDQGWQPPTVG
jgi:hypothetical protein